MTADIRVIRHEHTPRMRKPSSWGVYLNGVRLRSFGTKQETRELVQAPREAFRRGKS